MKGRMEIMTWIPERYLDLIKDETKAFACLATVMKDGSPQLTPVWFNTDGTHILINSAKGRVKDRNMRRNSSVAVVIVDPKDPYRYLQIRGKVVEISTSGAREHIDTLAYKYRGLEKYTFGSPDEIRVTYKILPEKISD
jgi:PPOX class probable F420-dependent enzyme